MRRLLDYIKLLHRFDAECAMSMLRDIWHPEELERAQAALYKDLQTHIEVAGSYGRTMVPTCGLAQGCSPTLIAATATESIEFFMLDAEAPSACKGALIDDRTLESDTWGGPEGRLSKLLR